MAFGNGKAKATTDLWGNTRIRNTQPSKGMIKGSKANQVKAARKKNTPARQAYRAALKMKNKI